MQERLNEKSITFYEVMKNAQESDDPVAYPIIGYALNPQYKIPLPPGIPPYIPSLHPLSVAPVEILNLSNKMYVMFSKDSKQFMKEAMMVRWMEDMAPEEALIMIHIKDQTLHTLHSKVTLDVLLNAMGWSRDQYDKLKASQLLTASRS